MSKLNCEQARALLHDRHDDLISAAGSDALEAHLASCDACRGWTLQMERIQVALGDLREASRHVGERIERRAVLRRPAPMWRRMRIAAALLLACGGTLAAWRIMATARSGEHVRAPLAPPTARNDSDANDVAAAPLPGTRNTADTAVPPGALVRTVANVAPARPAARVTLVGEEADRFFAVPAESASPNVHFFRIYRAFGDRADAASPGRTGDPEDEPVDGT